MKEDLIVYYCNFLGTESYSTMLTDRFRQSGHDRPIVFRKWNCYKDIPGDDGDLYIYDGVVLPALVGKGLLRPVSDATLIDGVFDWAIDKSRIRRKLYGVPVMLCANSLICRKTDDSRIRNIMQLNERVAIPLRSMLLYYCIQTVLNNRTTRQSLKVLEHLLDLIGGRDELAESDFEDYDGINRFARGECRWLLSFAESLHDLPEDDYVVSFADFSEDGKVNIQLFMSDFASVGKNAAEDKVQDCLDLIRIMADEEFVYDVCTRDGELQYFLPANRNTFQRLAWQDPLYDELFRIIESGENGLLLYNKYFYEKFTLQKDVLLQFLWEKAGYQVAD